MHVNSSLNDDRNFKKVTETKINKYCKILKKKHVIFKRNKKMKYSKFYSTNRKFSIPARATMSVTDRP